MNWITTLALVSLSLLLSACGSGSFYQPLNGSSSGYTETRLDSNTYRVTYQGSFASSQETVQNYLLYRCAQITAQQGYDFFVVISSVDRPIVSSYTSPGFINTYRDKEKGKNSYSIVTPGQTSYFTRDIASSVIKLFKGSKPANAANAYTASDILKYLSPSIKTRPR